MKSLLAIAALVFAFIPNAVSGNVYGPYEVTGQGRSVDEAKKVAFRKAVELALGAAIVSEIEVKDRNEVAKNSVLMHSAGYIDRFKIVEIIEETNGKVSVTLVAHVKPSMLNDYVLHKSKSTKKVDGETAGARISSYLEEREQGDKFVTSVLRDFPHKAFNIKQGKFEVKANERRQMVILVPYTISFNNEFLVALSGALKQIQDKECSYFCGDVPSFTVTHYKSGKFLGTSQTYYFNDTVRPEKVWNSLTGISGLHEPLNSVKIKLDLADFYGNALASYCTSPASLPIYKRGVSFGLDGGGWQESRTLQVALTEDIKSMLPNIDEIKVSMVKPNECVN